MSAVNSKTITRCPYRFLFVLPPERERVSSHSVAFSDAGFEINIAMFNDVDEENAKQLYADIMRDWKHNLVCVIFPPLDFYTPWFKNSRLPSGSGGIRDFLLYFKNAGITIQAVEMNWDGPFEDKISISESAIEHILKIARGCVEDGACRSRD